MMKLIAVIILSLIANYGHSQELTAFHDYRNYFMIFDNGKIKEIEHLPVESFQVGGKCIPYISNSGLFKVYYDGKSMLLADQPATKYFAYQNIMVYLLFDQLFVFEDGYSKLLSSHTRYFAANDSVVAFYDENTYSTFAYYRGNIYPLEKNLIGDPVYKLCAGDNLIAYYNDNSKYLKSFYNGKVWNILQTASKIDFQAGRDMLAFIDYAKNSFHLFFKGKTIDVEDYAPKSFKVGDDVLAYVDNLDGFKVFYDGEIQLIAPFAPDFYEIKDSLVVFAEQGSLKVFYKGKVHEYGFYVPTDYQGQESTLAFIGPNGWLEAFMNGQFIKVTNDLISAYNLTYHVISMNTTIKKMKVFSKGKIYDTN